MPDDFEPTVDEAIEFYHPDDRPTIRRAVTRCMEEGVPFDEELRIQTASGRDRWIHAKGEPIRDHGAIVKVRGAIQDVTDLIEHQRDLEEVRDRMEYVLDVTDSFIWEADLDTREVTRHGPFEELFGIEPSEIQTSAAFRERAVHPEDRESLSVKHKQATSGAQQVDEHVYRTNPENGPVRWILERPHVTFGQDDRERIVGLSTDVTAQVAHEKELERKNEQLEEFAGIISHDLRNPMSTAIGYLELYRETGEEDHLGAVESTLRRM
ncbi:MAG: PAS domain-containing protein, partial [Halobacteriales archaeon]|nr:PAS domain-containing protein [Halobacteriales archaeon]